LFIIINRIFEKLPSSHCGRSRVRLEQSGGDKSRELRRQVCGACGHSKDFTLKGMVTRGFSEEV
jgi:hypothetical protein